MKEMSLEFHIVALLQPLEQSYISSEWMKMKIIWWKLIPPVPSHLLQELNIFPMFHLECKIIVF
jgi:hypothetical protein